MEVKKAIAIQRTTQALRLVRKNELLRQAFEAEPAFHDVLQEMVSIVETTNPDEAYEHFKQECTKLVGYEANKVVLRSPAHYEAMMSFVSQVVYWTAPQEIDGPVDDYVEEFPYGDEEWR